MSIERRVTYYLQIVWSRYVPLNNFVIGDLTYLTYQPAFVNINAADDGIKEDVYIVNSRYTNE